MKETKVVKFGGSSLADAKQFKKVAEIILDDPTRRFVVASAPGKRYVEDICSTNAMKWRQKDRTLMSSSR